MESRGLFSQKVTGKTVLLVLLVLAIPAFFWFRYLYYEFVVKPDQVSPEMARMRDAMMRQHSQPAPSFASSTNSKSRKPSAEKGGKREAP